MTIPRPPCVALLFVFAFGVCAAPLTGQGTETLNDGWRRSIASSGLNGAAVTLDDSDWAETAITDTWLAQGLDGFDGSLWYRKRVSTPVARGDSSRVYGVLLGPFVHGRYEIFADGELLGEHGSVGNILPLPADRLFAIPAAATADGDVVVALRVYRVAWAADAASPDRPALDGVLFGPLPVVRIVARNRFLEYLLGDLATLLFVVIALVVGMYHLFLYATRYSERHYLWFGLGSVCFGVNAIAFSAWSGLFLNRLGPAYRWAAASGHLATVCFISFLFGVLDRPLGKILRAYQASHLLLAVFVVTVPLRWVLATGLLRFVWLLPILAVALILLVQDSVRGSAEARIFLVGGLFLVLAEVAELTRLAGFALPHSLPYVGFTALLLSAAAALAYRFARAHAELDDLRVGLDRKVTVRTAELEAMTVRAQKTSEAKTELLSTLSHELRAPLKSVLGFAHMALTEPEANLDERSRDFIERIMSSGRYALALVGNLLDLSRIEAGKLRIVPEDIDLEVLVRDVCGEFDTQAAERSTTPVAVVPDGLAALRSDPVRLKQILVNLVSNALKFSANGVVTVTVHTDAGRPTSIEVADAGVGIAPELLETVLEPYEQGMAIASVRKEGAGLGLSICKSLCALLGCELSITSELGVGTTATVILGDIPAGDDMDSIAASR